jgi:salicylate hydroxylase
VPPASVAIVGAGIGGLTAALALSARGIDVALIERRTGFAEEGAGIQLSPNASRVLFDLGLGPALRRAAGEPDRIVVRALRDGRPIGEVALNGFMQRRFGAPYLVIQRAALQTILLDAVRGRAGVRLLMGRRATALASGADRAMVAIETAAGAAETLAADVAVGADGLWSTARAAIGDRRQPVHRRVAAWRATIPREAAPPDLQANETGLWLGRAGHVVHYPIAGGRLLNIVALERRADPVEGWSAPGDGDELRRSLAKAAPLLSALLDIPDAWQVWSLFDLPAKVMGKGRIALLGDAAHPVLPFLAQGGALAIEDAAVLAASLAERESVRAALAAYRANRLRRVRRVQREARRTGFLYHATGPLAWGRDRVMRRLGPEGMAGRYAWLYGWTPPR